MIQPVISQEFLKSVLHYDLDTGIFTWLRRSDVREQWNGRYAGKRAGYNWTASGGKKYRSIRLLDWPFPEHRLAWLYVTGSFPEILVDHEDRDGTNNKWQNLRHATRAENVGNAGAWSNNKLGVRGVCLDPKSGRYRANIGVSGKQRYLGYFRNIEDAKKAYAKAANEVFGTFAGGA